MASFNEMMQKYVDADYETLVAIAKDSIVELLPTCKKVDTEHEGMFMLTSIVLSAIGADGVLTAKEKQFLRDVLGLSDEQISTFIKMYSSKMVDLVDKFADDLSQDIKIQTISLVLSVASVDEKISREETAFIRKLLD
ncbi:MAG: TerB family tellurite resistance protein [Clostridia bacterium]|nr:TerB family tellurite resistance protein [Clostridia bacterium]